MAESKCGLYSRVSTDKQADKLHGSLDTQLDTLGKYVDLKDSTGSDSWIVTKEYREEGKSGKTTNRPAFQEMVADVKSGVINVVLCTKIDRVSRSMLDFHKLIEIINECGGTFISLAENWDSSTAMGKFALTITLATAELEREQTGERVRGKMLWRAENGLYNGGQQRLGYMLNPDDKGVPLVDEEEREQVLIIYQTYLEEQSFLRTAKVLNEKGYRTKMYRSKRGNVRGGRKFSDTTIARILKDPFYIGKLPYGGEVYDGQHESIISKTMWRKVQQVIENNTNAGTKARLQKRHSYPLQGLVRCGICGQFMAPHYGFNKYKKPYFYYSCTKYRHKGSCNMKPVSAPSLEDVIVRRISELSESEALIQEITDNASSESSLLLEELRVVKKNLTSNMVTVQGKLDALIESVADRQVKFTSVSKKIRELEEQQEQIEKELSDVDVKILEAKKQVVSFNALKDTLTTLIDVYDKATDDERKELLRLHIDQVVWTPEEIQMALYETPAWRPEFAEKHCLVTPRGVEPPLPE